MDYLKFYKEVNAQKQIDSLARKYKNKKIVIYGAGLMSDLLFKNYDLSKLNIVAVCDRKFCSTGNNEFFSYKGIAPKELKTADFDVILVILLSETSIIRQINDVILMNTKNEGKKVEPLIKIPFIRCIKILLGI